MSLNVLYILKKQWPQVAKFDFPLDANAQLLGQPLLGKSTTWPGLAVAALAGIVIGVSFYSDIWVGLLASACVYLGHALGSFIKRRLRKSDGQFMLGVDHGDYIVLAGLVFGAAGLFAWPVIVTAIIITYIIHPLVTYLSYRLGLHKYPW